MDIGKAIEIVEVEEPAVPYEGEEVAPDYRPEDVPTTPSEVEVPA